MPDEDQSLETPVEDPPAEIPPAEEPPVEEPEQPPAEDPPADPPAIEQPEDDGGIEAAAAALDAEVARAFAFEGLTGQAKTTARRFHTLAQHVVDVLPEGNARAVALAKLRKARGAVLRPLLAV